MLYNHYLFSMSSRDVKWSLIWQGLTFQTRSWGLPRYTVFSIVAIKLSVTLLIAECVGRKCEIQLSSVQLSHPTQHPSAPGAEPRGDEGPDAGPGGQQRLREEHSGPAARALLRPHGRNSGEHTFLVNRFTVVFYVIRPMVEQRFKTLQTGTCIK